MTITWRLDRSIAAIGQYQHQASVLFSMENVIFWLILAALFQTYGLFVVLIQAEIMRWCTKIDKYQVCIAPLCRLTIFPGGHSLFNGQHDGNERKTSSVLGNAMKW